MGEEFSDAPSLRESRRPWWRLPLCWLGWCGHRPASDDTGCWGECATCGSRAGFVDRATLRGYADREIIRERIRRGEPVSLAEGLFAIGASADDIISIHVPSDASESNRKDGSSPQNTEDQS